MKIQCMAWIASVWRVVMMPPARQPKLRRIVINFEMPTSFFGLLTRWPPIRPVLTGYVEPALDRVPTQRGHPENILSLLIQ